MLSNEDADHAAMRDLVLVRIYVNLCYAFHILNQDRMNALWANIPDVTGHAAAADAAPATDHAVVSHELVPEAAALQSLLSKNDEQALQLLQANRKLEAQLQVLHAGWPFCVEPIHCTCDAHVCPALVSQLHLNSHQELKGRVASLEAEKERALAGIGSGKEKFCAQQ